MRLQQQSNIEYGKMEQKAFMTSVKNHHSKTKIHKLKNANMIK